MPWLLAGALYAGDGAAGARASMRAAMEACADRQRSAAAAMAGSVASMMTGSPRKAMETSISAQLASVERQEAAAGTAQDLAAGLQLPPSPEGVDCEPVPVEEANSLARAAAARAGLEPGLLTAVMRRESAFRPCAISLKGAVGLMQLMPATAGELGVREPFDPRQNVDAGARFLKQLLVRYSGDIALALGAYNAGPGNVDAAGGLPDFPETRNYVRAVLEDWRASSPQTASDGPW